jgi:hypothetical protein
MKKSGMTKRRKGFIFTLLAMLVIAFMIIEINIYFSAYQVRQESEPLKIRTRVVEEFATQLTPQSTAQASYVASYNAIYALTQDTAINPVITGNSTENISKVIGQLVWNGTRSDTGTVRTLAADANMQVWKTGIENLASKTGISLNISCSNFKVNQSDPWTVQINYTLNYTLWDAFTKTNISDAYDVSTNVPIIGFEDPLFKNKTTQVRNIFPYTQSVGTKEIFNLNSNTNGRGWFYGEIFGRRALTSYGEFNASNFSIENKKMILYTTNFPLVQDYGNMFGAVIYQGDSWTGVHEWVNVPFIATQSAVGITSDDPAVLIKSGSDSDYLVANFTIYNIERVKNFVTCGYYTNNTAAPSFFDRLSNARNDPTSRMLNESFGIETTVMGNWALAGRASIDYEYYQSISGEKVMGLTGCKYLDMCRDTALSMLKFRISSSHLATYGLGGIVCSGANAGRCG